MGAMAIGAIVGVGWYARGWMSGTVAGDATVGPRAVTESLRERVDVRKKRSGEGDVMRVWHVPMTSDEQTLFRGRWR